MLKEKVGENSLQALVTDATSSDDSKRAQDNRSLINSSHLLSPAAAHRPTTFDTVLRKLDSSTVSLIEPSSLVNKEFVSNSADCEPADVPAPVSFSLGHSPRSPGSDSDKLFSRGDSETTRSGCMESAHSSSTLSSIASTPTDMYASSLELKNNLSSLNKSSSPESCRQVAKSPKVSANIFSVFSAGASSSSLDISNMREEDYKIAVGWAISEGWNPGRDEFRSIQALDPKGLWITKNNNGECVASLSAVRYDSSSKKVKNAFIGLYIVNEASRGKGFGLNTFQYVLTQQLTGYDVGLFAVMQQVKNYEKSGFEIVKNNGQEVIVTKYHVPYDAKETDRDVSDEKSIVLKKLSSSDFSSNNKLAQYDESVCLASRQLFLQEWVKKPGVYGVVAFQGEAIVGYGIISCCYNGHKIGPLYADNRHATRKIFSELHRFAADVSKEGVDISVPSTNQATVSLMGLYKAQKTAEMLFMQRSQSTLTPNLGERVCGVTSLELGR